MTESEWMACNDPRELLEFLKGKVSNRKGNLFICAMCRLNWHLLYSDASRENVEVVERYVDGQASEEELREARYFAECPTFGYHFTPRIWREWTKTGEIPCEVQRLVEMGVFTEEDLQQDEPSVDPELREKLARAADLAYHAGSSQSFETPCLPEDLLVLGGPATSLFRCIFYDPFRSLPTLALPFLTWNDALIPKLAQQIYDERRFEDLPILADALMDAGCHDEEILSHCRSEGPHVKGCWVIDLLLNKQ